MDKLLDIRTRAHPLHINAHERLHAHIGILARREGRTNPRERVLPLIDVFGIIDAAGPPESRECTALTLTPGAEAEHTALPGHDAARAHVHVVTDVVALHV